MAHRPIVIDGAGAYGSAEGAGGVEPGLSNDRGGEGTCIDQVVVTMAPLRPSADWSLKLPRCIWNWFV